MEQSEKLAAAVKDLRGALTREEFEKQTGISVSTVQRYERPKDGPPVEGLRVLAEFAIKTGRRDLADIFVRAFRDYWGPVMCEEPKQQPLSSDERKALDLLREIREYDPNVTRTAMSILDELVQVAKLRTEAEARTRSPLKRAR